MVVPDDQAPPPGPVVEPPASLMFGVAHRGDRFIPAHAGNTSPPPTTTSGTTVHPRSRGEHVQSSAMSASSSGSSPLARGTLDVADHPPPEIGFIPARAGNTWRSLPRTSRCTVHPRSRGEHIMIDMLRTAHIGSSPLARGTRGRCPRARRRRSVHPRSRGEHLALTGEQVWPVGSSPLARGTPGREGEFTERHRFIPARAGNTALSGPVGTWCPVHPRSRGEHRRDGRTLLLRDGSSPLARGTPTSTRPTIAAERFIPARAGNTLCSSEEAEELAVHPRSRGEHSPRTAAGRRPIGSSPLARGTRFTLPVAGPGWRFIPARAGNTHPTARQRLPSPVHPRSRGEHSFQNLLIIRIFFDDNARTNGSVHIFNERETI